MYAEALPRHCSCYCMTNRSGQVFLSLSKLTNVAGTAVTGKNEGRGERGRALLRVLLQRESAEEGDEEKWRPGEEE